MADDKLSPVREVNSGPCETFKGEILINCYIILIGVLLPNTWASQRHEYLKHGGREPVAGKKMTLGQVVPSSTGQVVSSKILRIFK